MRRGLGGGSGIAENVACLGDQPAKPESTTNEGGYGRNGRGKSEAPPSGLNDLIQRGARQITQQAIEAELTTLLERYDNVKMLGGRRAVIRNGYLPEREVVTAIGQITEQVPKVRDRSGSGVMFNSSIVPPCIRKSPRVSAALPWQCIYVASRPAT
jgi:hypothetical protein